MLGKTTYFSRFSHIMVQVGGISRYQSASVASNNHSNVGTVTRAPFYQRQTSSAFSDGLTLWKMRSGGQGIEQLSEGYKIVIAMVADLAARMAEANPGMDNPLEASGIVLVDEIDLHLHPQWQREIILQLTTVFKNIQFIVTTHSPIIVMGAANVAQVVNLNMTDNETEDVSKSNIGAILLSELFGLPSLDLCNELQEKMKAPSTPYSGMLTNLE